MKPNSLTDYSRRQFIRANLGAEPLFWLVIDCSPKRRGSFRR